MPQGRGSRSLFARLPSVFAQLGFGSSSKRPHDLACFPCDNTGDNPRGHFVGFLVLFCFILACFLNVVEGGLGEKKR